MKAQRNGFTLVELLVVMGILALLVIIFVTQVPGVMNWFRVSMTKSIIGQLSVACDEYKRVYGAYPPQNVIYNGTTLEEVVPWGEAGYHSIYLMLQGPDGTGWGPTDKEPGIKEFGPTPESPRYVGLDYSNKGWGAPVPGSSYVSRAYFEDGWSRRIAYYRARMNGLPHVGPGPKHGSGKWRYDYYMNRSFWTAQYAPGENWQTPNVLFHPGRSATAAVHLRNLLRKSEDSEGHVIPHNDESYVLHSAGPDGKVGFWEWDDDYNGKEGYVPDPDPEDMTDGRLGVTDDIINKPD